MWLLSLLLLSASHAAPLDRVEVVVEDELVMTSDLHLDVLLQELDTPSGPFWVKPPEDAMQRLADAALLRHIASDLAIYQPHADDVQARLDQLVLEHFPSRGAWESFLAAKALTNTDVRVMLRRRMVVERYLSRNLRTSPAETEAWWTACNALIERERSRARIRVVPPREHL